ncbi:MAG: ribose 5-phosphate isomerase B [Bacillota bacterium]
MIALGCDHGGYELMKEVISYLEGKNLPFENFGTFSAEAVDYPVFGKKVAEAILDEASPCDKGILICGTGIGISITANRYKNIRAALCGDVFSAKATRLHNDANILALGARTTGVGHALEIVQAFLETEFSEDERHKNRIKGIDSSQ